MNLYIQVDENGKTVNHPAFEDNLIQAFGKIPSHWEPFVRVEKPVPTLYQTLQSHEPTYQKINGVWTDVWDIKDMDEEEKTSLIAQTESNPPGPNVTLDAETLQWIPNIEKPDDGKKYFWKYKTGEWTVIENTPA